MRHLASLGLTAVHDAGTGYAPSLGLDDEADPGWHTIDLYRELLARQALPIRIYAMLGGNGAYPGEAAYFSRPPVVGEGDGMLTVRAIKLGADGALGSRGAALEEAYSDEPGHRRRGASRTWTAWSAGPTGRAGRWPSTPSATGRIAWRWMPSPQPEGPRIGPGTRVPASNMHRSCGRWMWPASPTWG